MVLLLVIGPIVELWLIIQTAQAIGGWPTLLLLLVEGVVGAWVMKRQGRAVVARIDAKLRSHALPTRELADGMLILVAGALLLTPGFLTDVVGFALLFPPTRAVARAALLRRFTARMGHGFAFVPGAGRGGMGGFGGRTGGRGCVVDTTAAEAEPRRGDASPLGPGPSGR